MSEKLRVREISNDEGNRLLRIVRRSSGSVVTWRRAQMVLLPPKFTLPHRRQIKKIALARPQDHDLPFSTWSLSKLADSGRRSR
ncbi:MAG: hypothetical protein WBM50_07405 [Acidimicrobiales bacterium]